MADDDLGPVDPNYSRLREGLCPTCGGVLERQENRGWCVTCNVGWSMSPGEINLHFEPDNGSFRSALGTGAGLTENGED